MIRPASYVASDHLSNSDIKLFEESLRDFHLQKILKQYPEDTKEKKHFDVGDLVDIRLLQPKFLDRYAAFTDIAANDTIRNMMNVLLKRVESDYKTEVEAHQKRITDVEPDPIKDALDQYIDLFPWLQETCCYYYNAETKKRSRTIETVTTELIKSGSKYWQELVAFRDKILVSMESWIQSIDCYERLCKSKELIVTGTTHSIVEHIKDSTIYEALTGFEKYGVINGQKVKILGDLVLINHQTKIIYPYDLKTTRAMSEFAAGYKSYKYYRQGSLYSQVLKQNYKGYKIMPFTFIVVATQTDEKPELFEMSTIDLNVAMTGVVYGMSGYAIAGIEKLLEDINWHIENNIWEHRRSFYDNGRKNVLQIFGSTINSNKSSSSLLGLG